MRSGAASIAAESRLLPRQRWKDVAAAGFMRKFAAVCEKRQLHRAFER
jgi:hypothetical protein